VSNNGVKNNGMREVAVVAYAQTDMVRDAGAKNDVEMIMEVCEGVKRQTGLTQQDFDFTCSGSCDYLGGAAFAFVLGLDAVGAVPPISESHVEMDAAWALYEAWLKIQTGHFDTALIYGFGKCSQGDLPSVMTLQQDPYYVQPLWADPTSMNAIQARALIDAGKITETQMAEVVAKSRANAKNNPKAQLRGDYTVEQLLAEPTFVSPLRKHDCPPITDGASALILSVKGKAENLCKRPAYITGIDHRIESHYIGSRDLTDSPSTRIAAEKAGVANGTVDIAELHAPYSYQELLLKECLGLDDKVDINPSGGPLAGNIIMSGGLDRFGEVANRIINGEANRGVAHATSGTCLQQNLVAVLEGK
jgi:acetyl-CoA acetyltransferase